MTTTTQRVCIVCGVVCVFVWLEYIVIRLVRISDEQRKRENDSSRFILLFTVHVQLNLYFQSGKTSARNIKVRSIVGWCLFRSFIIHSFFYSRSRLHDEKSFLDWVFFFVKPESQFISELFVNRLCRVIYVRT